MVTSTILRVRPGFALAVALLGLSGLGPVAVAQSTFDPYRPDSSAYNSAAYPTLPNNLALPGSAREANAYNTPYVGAGGSRFNTYERYLNEGSESDPLLSRRKGPTIGVPYYDAYRQYDKEFRREYVPNREVDKRFYADKTEREQRYQTAIREKDPIKRARLLREFAQPQPTRPRPASAAVVPGRTSPPVRPVTPTPAPAATPTPALTAPPRVPAATPATTPGRRTSTSARVDPIASLASEGLAAISPTADRPGASTRTTLDRRLKPQRLQAATQRPRLPVELSDR